MNRRTKDTWTNTMCMGRVSQANRKKNSCITNLLGAFGKFNQRRIYIGRIYISQLMKSTRISARYFEVPHQEELSKKPCIHEVRGKVLAKVND